MVYNILIYGMYMNCFQYLVAQKKCMCVSVCLRVYQSAILSNSVPKQPSSVSSLGQTVEREKTRQSVGPEHGVQKCQIVQSSAFYSKDNYKFVKKSNKTVSQMASLYIYYSLLYNIIILYIQRCGNIKPFTMLTAGRNNKIQFVSAFKIRFSFLGHVVVMACTVLCVNMSRRVSLRKRSTAQFE